MDDAKGERLKQRVLERSRNENSDWDRDIT